MILLQSCRYNHTVKWSFIFPDTSTLSPVMDLSMLASTTFTCANGNYDLTRIGGSRPCGGMNADALDASLKRAAI